MRHTLNCLVTSVLATVLVCGPALAAEPGARLKGQQQKMKTCSADAKSQHLKGAERAAFMAQCLKAK